MNPINFPQANRNLGRPEGMTAEECGSLPVHASGQGFVSCWKPTTEELAALNRGEPVWLWILGGAHPPVQIAVENPWPEAPSWNARVEEHAKAVEAAGAGDASTSRLAAAVRGLKDGVRFWCAKCGNEPVDFLEALCRACDDMEDPA